MRLSVKGHGAASARIVDEALHQARLADPALTLDHKRRRPSVAQLADGSSCDGELVLPSHEAVRLFHSRSLHHADTYIRRPRRDPENSNNPSPNGVRAVLDVSRLSAPSVVARGAIDSRPTRPSEGFTGARWASRNALADAAGVDRHSASGLVVVVAGVHDHLGA